MAFPYNKTNSNVGPGGTRTGIEYDQDHQDHIDHNIPDDIGHYSQTAGSLITQTDGNYQARQAAPENLSNKPANLKEEIASLRGAIYDAKLAIDSTISFWYDVPTLSSLSDTEFTVTDTTNEDVFTVNANNVSFSNSVMVLNCYEENTGSFFFVKFNSDSDGTPVTEFSVNQDGDLVCGSIAATDADDNDVFTVNANNATFSNNVMVLNCAEENDGTYSFIKCNSDSDGTPAEEFSVNQDGHIVAGQIKLDEANAASPDKDTLYKGNICKAWAQIFGDASPTITSQYNIASVAANGAGDYTLTFTTAMTDTNYVCVTAPRGGNSVIVSPTNTSASQVQVETFISSSGTAAHRSFFIAVFEA